MNETLILDKLDSLSREIDELKKEIRKTRTTTPESPPPASLSQTTSSKDLTGLIEEVQQELAAVAEIRTTLQAGIELTEDIQPVAKQVIPKTIRYLDEIHDHFDPDKLKLLLTKTLTSADAITETLDFIKSAIELRDDLVPIAKQSLPKVQKLLNSLHEGEFQAEQLGTLLHTILLNIHTFSDLMNIISPFTELIKELEVAMKQTDFLANMNRWLDSLQQSNGIIKLSGTLLSHLKQIDLSDEQITKMCEAIESVNCSQAQPIGPVAMIRQFRDPKFQEALGAIFMIMQTIGTCLQACQAQEKEENV